MNLDTVESLEQAIARSISVQPFVDNIIVHIDRAMIASRLNDEFGYCELEGRMLTVHLDVIYKDVKVRAVMEFDRELDYPLMRIKNISL